MMGLIDLLEEEVNAARSGQTVPVTSDQLAHNCDRYIVIVHVVAKSDKYRIQDHHMVLFPCDLYTHNELKQSSDVLTDKTNHVSIRWGSQ